MRSTAEEKQLIKQTRAKRREERRNLLSSLRGKYLEDRKAVLNSRKHSALSKEEKKQLSILRETYFRRVHEAIGYNKLWTLVKIQVIDRFDFSAKKAGVGSTIRAIVFPLLRFAAVAVISFLIFTLMKTIGLFSGAGQVNEYVLFLVYFILLVFTIISDTIELTKTLYMSTDNKVLVTFPVKSDTVFLSKIIVYYIYELIRTFQLIVPIFLAFELCNSAPIGTYFWTIFAFLFLSAIPMVCAVILSIPTYYIMRFLNKYQAVKIVFFLAFVGFILWAVIVLIGLLPPSFSLNDYWPKITNQINLFMSSLHDYFPFVYTLVIIGNAYQSVAEIMVWFGWTLLFLLGAFAGGYFLARAMFFHFVSSANEFEGREPKTEKKNRQRRPIASRLALGIHLNAVDGGSLYEMIAVYIIAPILIFFFNKVTFAMDLSSNGVLLIYTLNVLLICLPVMAANAAMASVYSREGRIGYLLKSEPAKALPALLIKLIPSAIGSLASVIASVCILFYFSKTAASIGTYLVITPAQIVEACVCLCLFCLGHILLSAYFDLSNPKNEQYASSGNVIDNPNEGKSVVLAFVVSLLAAAFFYLVGKQDLSSAWIRLTVWSVLFVILGGYVFVKFVKTSYLEV